MLSSLWNQITANDDSSSDEEIQAPQPNLPISRHVDQDDIEAEQLLSAFPPFGTGRKKSGEGGGANTNSSNNHNHSPPPPPTTAHEIPEVLSNSSSVIASEWENFSPRKNIQQRAANEGGGGGRRKNTNGKNGGGGGDSIEPEGYLASLKNEEEGGMENKKSKEMREGGDKGDGFWNDEEMNVWYNKQSKKTKGKKGDSNNKKTKVRNHRRKKEHSDNRKRQRKKDRQNQSVKETSIYWNTEFRHRWIHGNSITTTSTSSSSQTQKSSEVNKVVDPNVALASLNELSLIIPTRPSAIKLGKHFTFSFDEAPTESSYSNNSESYDEEEESTDGSTSSASLEPATTIAETLSQEQQKQQQHQEKIVKHYNETAHWMPDQLCKQCYACEEKFTVFRRRHHCRLCGQVFCSRCSSFFVEIVEGGGAKELGGEHAHSSDDMNNSSGKSEISASGTIASVMNYDQNSTRTVSIRTCKMCYDQVSSSGPNGLLWYGGQMDKDNRNETVGNLGTVDGPKVKFDEHFKPVNPSISQHRIGFQGGSSSESEFVNLAMVKEKLELDRVEREKQEKAAKEEEATKGEEENAVGLLSKTISSTFSRRFGRLAESAAREAQIGDTGYNDEETKLVGTGVKRTDTNVEEMETKEKSSLENTFRPLTLEREVSYNLREQMVLDEGKELKEASRKIGLTAANHLEKLGRQLLRLDAPLLLKERKMNGVEGEKEFESWVNKLMMLATRCCSAVIPDVRNGDMLDIRPYCKIKVIPGGNLRDSAFVSGIIFHKNVSHKTMAKEILNPRIMLLRGGIEYTRTENRIATLETLLEQESRYLQILVNKIIKINPDILFVGRSVSRKAQELLMETKIVLLQHVKLSLMERVARQTGANILASTDHIMNQLGTIALGRCRRFRLVSFRDDDIWNNRSDTESRELRERKRNDVEGIQSFIENFNDQKNIDAQLSNTKLSNHQRQAVLAAGILGETVHDGYKAVKSGIAKRGVSVTYVMIEGCPSHLGCTIVLRGASRRALKQVKRLFKFFVNVSYNLKLETSYLRARRAKLPEEYKLSTRPIMSSSLCVEYGSPPQGRKIRPWNGGGSKKDQRSLSGKITALDHQSILISSVWMAGKTQCCPAEVKGISYYSQQDVSLGQFLRDSCFNLTLKCQNPNCKKSVLDHSLSFIHNDGLINITVEEMDDPIPTNTTSSSDSKSDDNAENNIRSNEPIATWTYCLNCKKVVTPLTFLSEDTWKFSFGKFLEVFFYNKTVHLNSPEHKCSCTMQSASTLYFGCGRLAARFTYERICPHGVYLRRYLPFDDDFHKKFTVLELNEIMVSSKDLFEKFHKQIEQTAKDTRQLFGSPAKPEHLQTLLSQLNEIDREVIRASGILKERIVSVTNKYNAYNQGTVSSYVEGGKSSAQEAFAYFPWHSRRYLFMLASAWNERLSTIGQALIAMKKLAEASQKVSSSGRGDVTMVQNPIADSDFEDVKDAMKRLKQLREFYSSNLNISEISTQTSHLRSDRRRNVDDNDDLDEEFSNEATSSRDNLTYNFSEEIDADVLASRQRFSKHGDSGQRKSGRKSPSSQRVKPPRRRSSSHSRPLRDSSHSASKRSRSQSPSQIQNKSKSVTAGGAVKSALTRLFNRASKEHDPHIVDLGVIGLGRPKMEAGVGGVVIPVYDDQPSTIIAHSLASADYASQFRRYAKAEMKGSDDSRRRNKSDRDSTTIEDYFAGSNGSESSHKARSPGQSSRRSQRRSNSNQPSSVKGIEKRMLVRNKTHIKHTFRDYDEKDSQVAKFVCTTFWSTQFQAVRSAFLKESSGDSTQPVSYNNSTFGTNIIEKNYVKSLSASLNWAVSGGKSGASFSKTSDERFIVKCISRTELQMFLDCAPAYFEYLSKAFFHGLPSMLAKIVGVYQIGYHNRVTGTRTMDQVAVMQNIFYGRTISRVFDLKGSLRGRFAKHLSQNTDKSSSQSRKPKKRSVTFGSDSEISSDEDGDILPSYRDSDDEEGVTYTTGQDEPTSGESKPAVSTFLDGDFLEFTGGRPLPLTDRAKNAFHTSVLNDTLFLSIINVLDYSILVGVDEEKNELVVGIIDFMRQYDILKQMERVGKSIPMVVGSEAPTIIQPPLYKARFINAMERYFMTVPSKWTTI